MCRLLCLADDSPNAVLHVECIFVELLHEVAHHLLAAVPCCVVQTGESLNVSGSAAGTRFSESFHLRGRVCAHLISKDEYRQPTV